VQLLQLLICQINILHDLSAFYNYQFVDGVLTINRMPITITPRDTTLTYGQTINGKAMKFNYSYDASNINVSERAAFLDSLKANHQDVISSSVILIDAKQAVNGQNINCRRFFRI